MFMYIEDYKRLLVALLLLGAFFAFRLPFLLLMSIPVQFQRETSLSDVWVDVDRPVVERRVPFSHVTAAVVAAPPSPSAPPPASKSGKAP
jgi:hypothetical protein